MEEIAKLLEPSETAQQLFLRCKSDPIKCDLPDLPLLYPGEPLEILGTSPSGYSIHPPDIRHQLIGF